MQKLLLLSICLMLIISIKAQGSFAVLAAASGSKSPKGFDYKGHKGVITLKDGRKVSGLFQYAYLEFPNYNIKQYSSDSKLEKRYKAKSVRNIALLGSDSLLSNKDSTRFYTFDHSPEFWRCLFEDQNVRICDCLFIVNEYPGLIGKRIRIQQDGKQQIFTKDKDFIEWACLNTPVGNSQNHFTTREIIQKLNRVKVKSVDR